MQQTKPSQFIILSRLHLEPTFLEQNLELHGSLSDRHCFLRSSFDLRSPPQDTPSILDWPLPQPAYDEVTAELEDQSEDQEVLSINKGLPEEIVATPSVVTAGRSESQSADLFQELQREVENVQRVSVCRSVLTDFWANICLCGCR